MTGHAGLLGAVVTWLLPLIGSLTLHEWGHAAAAVALGDETPREQGRLTLNPIAHLDVLGTLILPTLLLFFQIPVPFGWAKPVQFTPHRFTRRFRMSTGVALTAAAGPAMNLFIAAVAALALAAGQHFGGLAPGTARLIAQTEELNVLLFLFNLLPVPPLDGSRILIGLLPSDMRETYARLERYSVIFIGGLLLVGGQVVLGPSRTVALGLKQMAQVVFP